MMTRQNEARRTLDRIKSLEAELAEAEQSQQVQPVTLGKVRAVDRCRRLLAYHRRKLGDCAS